ncbi:hypothetical protein CDAR_123481 [Caerostris darwini]|uniref:Uncharacterized protein n=1 Tax=Caerostris darwini TaxID=1538125 RepID=A0AAV4WV48_9ARAC|nr:hypothetical protein CDAR_123481 [Caerostris darwini]
MEIDEWKKRSQLIAYWTRHCGFEDFEDSHEDKIKYFTDASLSIHLCGLLGLKVLLPRASSQPLRSGAERSRFNEHTSDQSEGFLPKGRSGAETGMRERESRCGHEVREQMLRAVIEAHY